MILANEAIDKSIRLKKTSLLAFSALHPASSAKQGLPSSRLISTPKALNSAEVTGDIGYKPSKGLKWKGKKAITQGKLQKQVQTKSKALEIQTRAQTGKSPMKNTS